MDTEQLYIYDENINQIGISERNNVHKYGFWHKTFHVWFIIKQDNKWYLLFQRRSKFVATLPNKLDATVAGHSLISDSDMVNTIIRESKEEIGFTLQPNALIPLGIRTINIRENDFLNREYQYIYIYQFNKNISELIINEQELSSLVLIDVNKGLELFTGESKTAMSKKSCANQTEIDEPINLSDFYSSFDNYIYKVFNLALLYSQNWKHLLI
jgi:isopentenyldiphosphate isomerase